MLSYNDTIELEKNIAIKNEANKIYNDFLSKTLSINKFKNGKFVVWSDSYNAEYIHIDGIYMHFTCAFLHEYYTLKISPECIFDAIKSEYRGLDHFKSWVYQ